MCWVGPLEVGGLHAHRVHPSYKFRTRSSSFVRSFVRFCGSVLARGLDDGLPRPPKPDQALAAILVPWSEVRATSYVSTNLLAYMVLRNPPREACTKALIV